MANNFRGTKRTLYNPMTVKYLSESEARSEYKALRSIALKRNKRLVSGGIKQPLKIDLPASSQLDENAIAKKLLDVSMYLRDPRSFVRPAREFEARQREAFAESPVIQKNIKQFGNFMEDMRRRAGGRLEDSPRARQAYDVLVSKGMRAETIEKHFSQYIIDSQKAEELAIAAMKDKSKKRLTISRLKELLSDEE